MNLTDKLWQPIGFRVVFLKVLIGLSDRNLSFSWKGKSEETSEAAKCLLTSSLYHFCWSVIFKRLLWSIFSLLCSGQEVSCEG